VEGTGSDVVNNFILSNSIFANTNLGIDLGGDGVTANDPGDTDVGANTLQNYPVLLTAISDGAGTTVNGTLNSLPNATYTVELYRNTSCHTSGFGEGKFFLGSANVSTDGGGNGAFTVPLPFTPIGQQISSTATDTSGNTSEFSQCVTVSVNETPTAVNQSLSTPEETGLPITLSGSDVDSPNLTFAIETSPNAGTLSAITGTTCNPSGGGSSCTASVTFTPHPNFTGGDGFTFTVSDDTDVSGFATVTVTVNPVPEPPVAKNDTASVLQDSGANTFLVQDNDFDPDHDPLTIVGFTQGTIGSVATSGGSTAIEYTPYSEESGTDSFTYTISDGDAGTADATATVNVTITTVLQTLTVNVTGPAGASGAIGTVTSSPAGIGGCSATSSPTACTADLAQGSVVTLTAAPDSGFGFGGWIGGGCTGVGTCVVAMDAAKSVTAAFVNEVFTLSIQPTGIGLEGSRVTAVETGTTVPLVIDCGRNCQEVLLSGTQVTLTAIPAVDADFAGWSGGGCAGTGDCTVIMTTDLTDIVATFVLNDLTCNPATEVCDSDGDGVPDSLELEFGTNPNSTDSDNDGIEDGPDTCKLTPNADNQADEDGDSRGGLLSLGDICDSDADNDGVEDKTILQTNPDGTLVFIGIPVSLGGDNCPLTYNQDQEDFDDDGQGDLCDLDADGDGFIRLVTTPHPFLPDVNRDGLTDPAGTDCNDTDPLDLPGSATCPTFDTAPPSSKGKTEDPALTDSDGDTLTDTQEAELGTDPNHPDTDNDGVTDGPDSCKLIPNPLSTWVDVNGVSHTDEQPDVDLDTLGDACDTDADADGVPDKDAGFVSIPPTQGGDNCSLTQNPTQADFDGDLLGDSCDSDADGDGVAVTDSPADCHDFNPDVNPNQLEVPDNGIDDDCNSGTPDSQFALVVKLVDPNDPTATNIMATWLPEDGREALLTATVVDQLGALSPQPPVTFTIVEVTAYPGTYTNDENIALVSDDFAPPVVAGNQATLIARDYGASITLQLEATVPLSDATVTLTHVVTIPPDRDGDRLPDAWEDDFGDLSPDGDIDTSVANTLIGDGLTNMAEYRGLKWQRLVPVASGEIGPADSHTYQTPTLLPDPAGVTFFRGNPRHKDLFVEYTGFENTAACECPFALGTGFANAEIDVHAMEAGTTPHPGRHNIDMVFASNDRTNPFPFTDGHTNKRGVRDWSWDTKGSSGIGTAEAYGANTTMYQVSFDGYMKDRTYTDGDGSGMLEPVDDVTVEDSNDNAVIDRVKGNSEDVDGNGVLDGDLYVAQSFNQALSVFDIDNDGNMELPMSLLPTNVDSAFEYTGMQVLKHTITHELGHAVGSNHTQDSLDMMYEFSNNWSRDSHLGASAAQMKVHNTPGP
jgi:hypothetical protein